MYQMVNFLPFFFIEDNGVEHLLKYTFDRCR